MIFKDTSTKLNEMGVNPVERYLEKTPEPQKSTLKRMRRFMAEILSESTEWISYGISAFKLNGTVVGGFAAAKIHRSYYPFSGNTLRTLRKILVKYEQTKSALHFPLDKPLSKKIVKLLVFTRIAEIRSKKQESKDK